MKERISTVNRGSTTFRDQIKSNLKEGCLLTPIFESLFKPETAFIHVITVLFQAYVIEESTCVYNVESNMIAHTL